MTMERNKLLSADYLDILFDGRNKKYGSYELRRKYGDRARNAAGIVILSAAILAALPVIAGSLSPEKGGMIMPVEKEHIFSSLPAEPAKPQPVLPSRPHVDPPVVARPTFRIVANNEATNPPRPNEEVAGVQPGPVANPGLPGGDELSLGGPSSGPAGNKEEIPAVAEEKPYTSVEQMPVFNGDISQYLSDHLRYPEAAREAGETGRPVIRFVVSEDGSIIEAEVARKASPALDAEALRVVRSMPRWRPGKQGGKAVKVYFTLPVTFVID